MTSSTAIKPKDLVVGQRVRIDGLVGVVEKNTPKSGRLRIREDDAVSTASVAYRDIVEVELIENADSEMVCPDCGEPAGICDCPTPGDDRENPADEQIEDEIMGAASKLGIDFDPSNCDVDGLREAVEFVQQHAATLKRAGIHPREVGELVTEQLLRIEKATNGQKDGLAKKALREFILTGDSGQKRAAVQRQMKKTAPREPGQPREGSTMAAVLVVLKSARRPMTGQEVYEKIAERKLAPGLKGKTPAATVTAAMNVAVARQPHLGIVRPEPGKFALASKAGK